MPAPAEIQAVRKVLYEPSRLSQMRDDASSIVVLLNLGNQNPNSTMAWFIPATGQLSVSVVEAAQRCRRIATALLAIRGELVHVAFSQKDKKHLLAALQEQAASWQARASAWAAPGRPTDVDSLVAGISRHLRSALAEAQHVKPYLKEKVGP